MERHRVIRPTLRVRAEGMGGLVGTGETTRPLRVGVNAWALRADGGGARYAFTSLMAELVPLEPAFTYVLFVHPLGKPIVVDLVSRIATVDSAAAARVRIVEIDTPEGMIAHEASFDLIFAPLNNHEPRLYDRPSVAILHDAQEHEFPHYFSPGDLAARREVYPEICKAATVLVAISRFCRDSFVRLFDIDPAKIDVIYNAPQEAIDGPAPARQTWFETSNNTDDSDGPAPGSYFLYPANTYAHKNHAVLLDVAERWAAAGAPTDIVFVGNEVEGGFPLRAEIERRGLGPHCRVLENVPAQRLRWLYTNALATVIPTAYEGFCIPAIEAMRCGCPVICSNIPALREVAGEHALFVEPGDADALSATMDQIANGMAPRTAMIRGGRARAAEFCWRRSAARMQQAFLDAVDRFDTDHHITLDILIHASGPARGLDRTLRSLIDLPASDRAAIQLHLEGVPSAARAGLLERCAAAGIDAVCLLPSSGSRPLDRLERIASGSADAPHRFVMEMLAGHTLRPTALASLRSAAASSPGASIILGEALERSTSARGHSHAAIAHPRTTHDGVWTVRGALYQEMVVYRASALGALATAAGEPERRTPDGWRWALVTKARSEGALCTSRRLLAGVRPGAVGPNGQLGRVRFYDADGRERRAMAHRVEPVLKRVKPLVPRGLWERGRSMWFSKVVG